MKISQIRKAKDYFSKPYELCKDNRIKLIFSFGNALFIMLFLWLFGPFGLALFPEPVKLNLILWYSITCSGITIIHVYLLQDIIIKKYTIGTTLLWWIWTISVCGIGNFIVWEVIMNNGLLVWKYLPKMMVQTYLVGLLPVIFVILLYEKYYLKRRIKVINQVNNDILQHHKKNTGKTTLTLMSSNLSEVVTVDSDSLLYIVSADNYAEVNWLENGRVKKYLLRQTLAELEKVIKSQCRYIVRCHNGYIVNINKINSVSGNSGGYRIVMQGIGNPIPVSRKYRESFFRAINK